jgi:ABC-type amino acid transport system permease subunit
MSAHADQTRKQVKLLAYAGLLPFIGLSVLLWLVDPDLHPFVALALAGYGASIVSFLGGIHWGLGFRNASRMHNAPLFNFGWGVVPSLLAWIAITMPAYAGLPLLALILGLCYAVDRKTYPEAGLEEWLPMRLHLTVVAAISCLMGAAAT